MYVVMFGLISWRRKAYSHLGLFLILSILQSFLCSLFPTWWQIAWAYAHTHTHLKILASERMSERSRYNKHWLTARTFWIVGPAYTYVSSLYTLLNSRRCWGSMRLRLQAIESVPRKVENINKLKEQMPSQYQKGYRIDMLYCNLVHKTNFFSTCDILCTIYKTKSEIHLVRCSTGFPWKFKTETGLFVNLEGSKFFIRAWLAPLFILK